jgi:hypothetical protein
MNVVSDTLSVLHYGVSGGRGGGAAVGRGGGEGGGGGGGGGGIRKRTTSIKGTSRQKGKTDRK